MTRKTHDSDPHEQAEQTEAEAPAVEEEPQDVEGLRARLNEETEKAQSYLANWQRAAADYQNFKRRVEQERSEVGRLANASLVINLLPLLDDLERALRTVDSKLAGLTWIDGIWLIYRKFQAVLENAGCTEIEADGQPFDPKVHEAIGEAPGEEGKVISVVQKGYLLGDRVLRPAMVIVGKKAEEPGTLRPVSGQAGNEEEGEEEKGDGGGERRGGRPAGDEGSILEQRGRGEEMGTGVAGAQLTIADEVEHELRLIIEELSSDQSNLKVALLKCIHICNLLHWEREVQWLESELLGYEYYPGRQLPSYRQDVPAYKDWRPYDIYEIAAKVVEEGARGPAGKTSAPQEADWGIDVLSRYARVGLAIPTGRKESRWIRVLDREIEGQEVIRVDKESAQSVLDGLRNELFRWASQTYAALRFGDVAGDIWQSYRLNIAEELGKIGLGSHLQIIESGILSAEPQEWRQAMWSCRDLLHDLAAHLWQDARPTYSRLPDEEGNPIIVTADKYVNRLIAYLHQKGITGTIGDYLKAEWRRLRNLSALASKAHDAVTLDEARLLVVSVYVVLGELIYRTDMVPVSKYK